MNEFEKLLRNYLNSRQMATDAGTNREEYVRSAQRAQNDLFNYVNGLNARIEELETIVAQLTSEVDNAR